MIQLLQSFLNKSNSGGSTSPSMQQQPFGFGASRQTRSNMQGFGPRGLSAPRGFGPQGTNQPGGFGSRGMNGGGPFGFRMNNNSQGLHMRGFQQGPNVHQTPKSGGGFLQKLFSGGKNSSNPSGGAEFARHTIGSLNGNTVGSNVQSGVSELVSSGAQTGSSKLLGALDKVQGFMKMAESAAPIVEQYGPLVRNIPALISLFKDSGEEDKNKEDGIEASSDVKERKKEPTRRKKAKERISKMDKHKDMKQKVNKNKKSDAKSKSMDGNKNKNNKLNSSSPKLYV
jgi:hypothetical protein